jgi:prevent-host-death family protein
MSQYNIAEAKAQLSELTRRALAGEEIVIARDSVPFVRLVPVQPPKRPRQPGSGKGQLLWIAPDFDAIPEEFENVTRCGSCDLHQ